MLLSFVLLKLGDTFWPGIQQSLQKPGLLVRNGMSIVNQLLVEAVLSQVLHTRENEVEQSVEWVFALCLV